MIFVTCSDPPPAHPAVRSVSARDVRVSRENLRYSAFLFAFLLAVAFLFEVNMWAALLVGAAGGAAITWRSFGELRSILGR